MFSLVQFDNGEYYILQSKRVKIVQGKNCIVKYTGGGMYNADLIDSSGKLLNLYNFLINVNFLNF